MLVLALCLFDFFCQFQSQFFRMSSTITISIMKIRIVEPVTLKQPWLFYDDFNHDFKHDFNHDFLHSGTHPVYAQNEWRRSNRVRTVVTWWRSRSERRQHREFEAESTARQSTAGCTTLCSQSPDDLRPPPTSYTRTTLDTTIEDIRHWVTLPLTTSDTGSVYLMLRPMSKTSV